jgi:hypothetical protein
MSQDVGPEELPNRVPGSGERFGGGHVPDYTVLTPQQELIGSVQALYEVGDLVGLTRLAGGALLDNLRPIYDSHIAAGGTPEILDYVITAARLQRANVLAELENHTRKRVVFPASVVQALVMEATPGQQGGTAAAEKTRTRLSSLGGAFTGRKRAEDETKEG